MQKYWILGFITLLGILAVSWYITFAGEPEIMSEKNTSSSKIKYVAIGDSYTIGNGVAESGRWPNVLVKNLRDSGVDIELIANPAVSGNTVRDAIVEELPVVKRLKPDFVTVLIGANDNFRETDPSIFKTHLAELLDKLQGMLKNPESIVLITIPDYSKSPAGQGYETEAISKSIEEYNRIINDEANARGLKVADIFPVSQTMTGASDYIRDGLHPSAQGYAKWERVIYPVVFELLSVVGD